MSETANRVDPFKQKFEEARAEQASKAVAMEFAGFPCKAIPLPYSVFVVSGRMPEYLTNIVLAEPDEKAAEAREPTAEEVKESEKFRCTAVCRVLVEPRVIPEGTPAEGEYLYADLVETAPAFISAVFQWIMRGCPMPEAKKGDEVLSVADLERFPKGGGRGAGAKSRRARKGGGPRAVGAATVDRKRTRKA